MLEIGEKKSKTLFFVNEDSFYAFDFLKSYFKSVFRFPTKSQDNGQGNIDIVGWVLGLFLSFSSLKAYFSNILSHFYTNYSMSKELFKNVIINSAQKCLNINMLRKYI